MSDRQIAKNRFHKGLSAALRQRLRGNGLSLDEEAAQFALGGRVPFTGMSYELVQPAVDSVLSNIRSLTREWEQDHPGRDPYPPSFPERALRLVNEALEAVYADGSPEIHLTLLRDMCERELDATPVSVARPDEEL